MSFAGGRRLDLLPCGVDPLRTSVLGVASPEPCTSVWAYLRHLLLCARSERFSPLVEHVLRTTQLPLDPGGRIPRVLLERGTPSPWNWLAWRLLDPEGRRQRPVAEKHPVGAVQRRVDQLPWGEAANLQANAYRERIVVSWARAEAYGLLGYARRIRENEVVRQDKAELPAVLRFDPLPVPPSGWYLARVDVHGRTFDRVAVLVHELAHILLGHFERPLGAPHSRSVAVHRPNLSQVVGEVEAASVTYVVAQRRGSHARPEREYLRNYFELARRACWLHSVDLVQVFRAAETLLAWARSDHDRMSVLDPRPRTPAPMPLVGVEELVKALLDCGMDVLDERSGHAPGSKPSEPITVDRLACRPPG